MNDGEPSSPTTVVITEKLAVDEVLLVMVVVFVLVTDVTLPEAEPGGVHGRHCTASSSGGYNRSIL